MVGKTLAHYEILEKLGSGGMGEVYLARDQKLDRKIALKILPADNATRDRLRRFEQEAKAVAALNHPNIVHVYSVEESDGVHFITMEWVAGKTLTATIPNKGFSLSRFLDFAIPMADAVSAAHERGIIHRDLKPDNVVLSDDGRVKVLDFGLAKLRPEADGAVASESPTVSATADGHVVGTVAYMSPEQAEGKSVDHRTDIFSLGIVFFEMLSGERPFTGDTPASTMSAIIKDPAPALGSDLPRDVARIVKRCLTKDVSRRFQSAADLRNDLEDLKEALGSGELRAQPQRQSAWSLRLAGAVIGVGVAIAVFLLTGKAPDTAALGLTNPVQVTSAVGVEDYPTWSPDGERLAYESNQSGNWDIWVTQLVGGDKVNFTADHAGDDRFPSWSPDGRQIAFLSRREGTWGVYTVSALGGSPRRWLTLGRTETVPKGRPQWSADGTELLVGSEDGNQNIADIVSLSTQEQRRFTLPRPESRQVLDVSLFGAGETLAFVSAISPTAEITQIMTVRISEGAPTLITDGTTNDWHPTWSRDGTKLFFVSNRGGSMDLWQQTLSADFEPKGDAEPLTTGMGLRTAIFSADARKLAYSQGRLTSNVWRVPILEGRRATWADAEPITSDNAYAENVSLASDGRIFISSDRTGNQDLYVLGRGESELRQLTFETSFQTGPKVSPDGTEIAFYAFSDGSREIMIMPAGGGPARTIASHPTEDTGPAWSPDGTRIAFGSRRGGSRDIWIVDISGGEPTQLTTDLSEEVNPWFTRDGQWIYFASSLEGDLHIWRVSADGGEPERVTRTIGFTPRFSSDGSILYFTEWPSRGGNLWAKSLSDGEEYPVTDFAGRPGRLGWDMDVDDEYFYFTWWEDVGDIWVMDVVTDEDP